MANSDEKKLMKFKGVRGYGIFIEAIFLSIMNLALLYFDTSLYEYIEESISSLLKSPSISAINIVAILTSLLLAIGFIYYLGYIIARRKKEPNAGFGGGNLREVIIPYGAILFSAIFIPFLIVFLLTSRMYVIMGYIAINIVFVCFFGWFNERITQRYEAMGLGRNKRYRTYAFD